MEFIDFLTKCNLNAWLWTLRALKIVRGINLQISEASKKANFLITICWKIEGFGLSELPSSFG